jgi:hypothetical protein
MPVWGWSSRDPRKLYIPLRCGYEYQRKGIWGLWACGTRRSVIIKYFDQGDDGGGRETTGDNQDGRNEEVRGHVWPFYKLGLISLSLGAL